MSEQSAVRIPLLGKISLVALAALHAFGLYVYITQQVLLPVWLWENQDYMMFLWPVYYHVHVALMIGHMYVWGPLLLARRYRKPGWSLYWVSFLCAYVLTAYPLLQVQRFAELHGEGAYRALQAYYALLLAGFVLLLLRQVSLHRFIAFHLFSGLPIILLGLQGKTTFGAPNSIVVWGLLALHLAIAFAWVWQFAPGSPLQGPFPRSRLAGILGTLIVLIVGAACLANQPLQLLVAQRELKGLLEDLGYGKQSMAPPLADPTPPANFDYKRFRTYDGSWNNLDHPEIGKAGNPLGRYIPGSVKEPRDVLAAPSVIDVSQKLLKQDAFQSAAPFNALAMAWVNFFVHDFYNRGVTDTLPEGAPSEDRYYKIPVEDGKFLYMLKLPSSDGGHTHVTTVTHWFDASQVYGSDEATARKLRDKEGKGSRLRMDGEFLPTIDMRGQQIFLTGDTPRSSLHIGSLLLHHIWASEHNYIASQLEKEYPSLSSEEVFHLARLIVAAEIVKVHSVEWTAQLVGDPISYEFFQQFWKRFGKEPYRKDIYYAVSEEFVSSYILHEIVPPRFDLLDQAGNVAETVDFVQELFLLGGQNHLRKHHVANVLNSFGINPMGLIVPFNVAPAFHHFQGMNFLPKPGADAADYVDLAAIPVARDRDAHVPYYNDLRAKLGMPRLRNIREISKDPKVVATLDQLYGGDVNKIEYIIGFKSESRPSNWALTPGQVRTFLPVVVYRILADRFYTQDFNEKTYTAWGMKRLQEVKFYDIIRQCYGPSLLPKDRNHPIFHQWNK